jgi:hypothetical protein
MKSFYYFTALLFLSAASTAQTVLLEVDRPYASRYAETGPNLKQFTHAYFRFGLPASNDFDGARIVYENSVHLALGVRKKYRISRTFSFGYDMELDYDDFKLRQEKGKTLPDTILYNKTERLDYSGLALGFYGRLNFDPGRGNYLGNFLDIGISGLWDFSVKHITKSNMPDDTQVKTITKHLPYVNNVNARLFARLGKNHFSVFGYYRLTPLFKSSYNYPDLPRLTLGLEAAPF